MTTMNTTEVVRSVLAATLQVGDRAAAWTNDTRLLGAIPELDSMAVVTVLTELEERLGIDVPDDEISAETFETLGALVAFVESKR
jgi:acyl carrier protein